MSQEYISSEPDIEEKDPAARQLLDMMSDRFKSGEAPHTLDELHELADDVNAEGEERGFSTSRSYVDANGELVMIARKEGDTPSWWEEPRADKTCRILFDGKVVEIVIPLEWQQRTIKFRSDEAPEDVIYDVTDVDRDSLPDDMKQLVDKFGPELTRILTASDSPVDEVEPNSIPDVAIGLSDIRKNIERQEAEVARAAEEAGRIEEDAKSAAERVKKGMFMSASKLIEMQDQAYRNSIQESMRRR